MYGYVGPTLTGRRSDDLLTSATDAAAAEAAKVVKPAP